jgi:hypothetical protein
MDSNASSELNKEFLAEARNLVVVPTKRVEDIGLSFGPKDELEAHPFRRMRALTSDQGEPKEGSR